MAERAAFRRVSGVNPHADVAAFRVADDWGRPDLPIELNGAGAMLSEDVLLLGYPYGLSFREADDGIPFVKKGCLSAIDFAEKKGVVIYYLDVINNIGFSGGPVCLPRLAPQTPKILGIVHGYHQEWVSLEVGGKPAKGALVAANTGITLAYSVEHVLQAINANPIPYVVGGGASEHYPTSAAKT